MSSPCAECKHYHFEYYPGNYYEPDEYDEYCVEDMVSFDTEAGEGCYKYEYENKEDKEDCDPDAEYDKWKDGL